MLYCFQDDTITNLTEHQLVICGHTDAQTEAIANTGIAQHHTVKLNQSCNETVFYKSIIATHIRNNLLCNFHCTMKRGIASVILINDSVYETKTTGFRTINQSPSEYQLLRYRRTDKPRQPLGTT